jgi:hypothetical protein
VRYLVVGGYAVALHGYPRTTGDLDVNDPEATTEAVLRARIQLTPPMGWRGEFGEG